MSYSDVITFAIGMVIIMMITLFFATKIQLAVFFAPTHHPSCCDLQVAH